VNAPMRQPELLPPFGRETALWARGLTKTEEEETIIINCSGRSTYPDEKSVLRSGATPHQSLEYRTPDDVYFGALATSTQMAA
jgi:hypothetical protein